MRHFPSALFAAHIALIGLIGMIATCVTACDGEDPPTDGGLDTGIDSSSGCLDLACDLACEHGFVRDADGCETCACNPAPDDGCTSDDECVLARSVTGCCGCRRGYSESRVEGDPCIVMRGETAPAGCYPDPAMCAVVDCAACQQALRAICTEGECQASAECASGDVVVNGSCITACASHDDCTLGADYGNCCGGCQALPRAFLEQNPCYAERQSDTTCAPSPGSCDGLGCPSPATDCTGFGGSAVCMDDGLCREAGADGSCPSGFTDTDGVCVPDA